MYDREKTLVLGFGNPARGDDGLGPALIARLEDAGVEWMEPRADYQLCVEDAMDIGRFARVIFADASKHADPPFAYYPLPDNPPPANLDTHSLSPEALMFLARNLFNAHTPASVLAIRGYRFEPFVESLSPGAAENLQQAFCYLIGGAKNGQFSIPICPATDFRV